MSIEAMSTVWKHSKRKGSGLLLLLAIADYANDDGAAWPSVDSLAKKCRMSIRNTQTLLTEMAGDGEITIDPQAGPHGTNIYRLANVAGAGGAKIAGVQTSAGESSKGGANQRRQIAPNPLGTVKEPLGKEPAGAGSDTKAEEQEFFDQWAQSYEMQFGRKYLFVNAAKDRTKLRKLLTVTKATAGELMKTATKAWARGVSDRAAFNCRNAVSISAFADRFEEITHELTARSPNDLPGARPKPNVSKAPPPGLKPEHERPTPGFDEDHKEIGMDEWERRYPLENYYNPKTMEPLK
jgi:hypothetical protein